MSRNQPNNPAMGQKSTNAGASQTPRPGIPNPASQSFFPIQPAGGNQTQRPAATNSPPQPPTLAPMSVTDMRGQILANALVVFPHIVSSHNEGFSSVPPRAQDIFEVSISLRHDYYQPDFIARLTHRHALAPALHVLLLGSVPMPTPERALHSLLNTTCTMLGTDQAIMIERQSGDRTLHPVLHGSQEGDRHREMELARVCVGKLREGVRSQVEARAAEAKEAARLKLEANAAEMSVLRTKIAAAEPR